MNVLTPTHGFRPGVRIVRIRYIGEQPVARAFDHTFHRKRLDRNHGLEAGQIATLTMTPLFEVDTQPNAESSNGPTYERSAG